MRLAPGEFNLLWSRLGLSAKPLELNVPAQGATLLEAARLSEQAASSLRARGLIAGEEPASNVAGLLTAVSAPIAQVDLRWARGVDVPELRGLVALRGKHGALALWDGEHVSLRWVKHAVFVEELVRELGDAPPGAGRSVTTPADLVLRASRGSGGDAERFQSKLVGAGVSRDDARVWRAFVDARRIRAGQIGASGVDQWGKAIRVPWVIHVFDTERGRYATYERGGYRTVVGVDTGWLVTVVRELYTDAIQDRRNW